jgi:hypothetical protein
MPTNPDPGAQANPPTPPATPAEPEPFVYPTIGTEKVLEKGNKPSGLETREQRPGLDGSASS